MGSTGTGSFTDYPGEKPKSPTNNGEEGSKGIDNCGKAIATKLEEVARCAYYVTTKGVPPVGTAIEVHFDKRIVARTLDGIDIGYLPTKFNYLKFCLEEGYVYEGQVTSSSVAPIPMVSVDISPV